MPRDFACPVCAGRRLGEVATATGSIAYCHACFHGVRPAAPSYAYAANAMCGLGTAPEALAGEAGLVILINSIDFAPRIEQDIARLLPGHGHELVRIGDVIEHFRGARLAGG